MADIETPEMVEEKPKKRRKTKAKETFSITLDDGAVIDLDSYDWGDVKLTQKEKLFIFWFTYPKKGVYHEPTAAARKAGYSAKSANQQGYFLRKSEKLAPIIAKFDNNLVKTRLEDAYHKIIDTKINRINCKRIDFYDFKEVETESGDTYTRVTIKKPEELTEIQKACIDGVDYAGQRSIPNYRFVDTVRDEKDIIELYKEVTGEGKDKDDYEVETTAEIIKGNLQVKTKVIKKNAEITELSDLKNKAANDRAEED